MQKGDAHGTHSAVAGRNQTKARIALVSLGIGIGLDQPTGKGTANNANNARARPDARLEAMSLRPSFAFFALFAVPFPFLASMRYPTRHDFWGKRPGETARYGQCIGK